MRKSGQHSQLSAAAHYHGMVDYNKTVFLRQVAISLHIKNRLNGKLGHLMANMANLLGQQCTITGVKKFTSHQLPAMIHWSFSLTILQCRSFPQLADYSWLSMTGLTH
jgi:hypothetical protein